MNTARVIILGLMVGCQAPDTPPVEQRQTPVAEGQDALAGETMMLPNWATEAEEALQRSTDAPSSDADAPPPAGFRVPAEYEPVEAVVMTYTGSTSMLRDISAAVAKAGAKVWMVAGPSKINGVPAEQYKVLGYEYNSIWARDYGPFGIDEATGKLAIVDTVYRHYASRRADDAIPCKLAGTLGAGCFNTSLILDGGNYMTDGKGHAFLTRRVYEWNRAMSKEQVDDALRGYFAGQTIHMLDYATEGGGPADGTGHIDMFAKLLGDCKVMVAETQDEPYKTATEKAAAYFSELACGEGKYQVVRTKAWDDRGTWYTYTNSLIVNKTVIIPNYDDGDNEAAAAVYRAALPDYEIIGVNSESTIGMGGSIHCVTKEIPAFLAPL